jgi:hypothetical protein
MKKGKVCGILCIIIFLSLLLSVTPAAPVLADRGITLSPEKGNIGDLITLTGTDFNKSTDDNDKYAAVFFSSDEADTLDDIDDEVIHYAVLNDAVWLDEDGDFEITFRVPDELDDGSKDEDVSSGTYYVYVCHYIGTSLATRIRAVSTFTVSLGEISVYPSRGPVDTLVEIVGSDFSSNKNIRVEYDGFSVPIYSGNKQTNSRGDFISVIRIPESSSGSHAIVVNVSGEEADDVFGIEPGISINPTSGETGTTVTVTGAGFSRTEKVVIWFYNIAVATTATNVVGSYFVSFPVPELEGGFYNVDAVEGANVAKTSFSITTPPPPPPPQPQLLTSISMSATIGHIGQGVVMGGAGFEPSATVTIKYDDELLDAVSTDSNGVFAAAFTVPASRYGNHIITASDGTNTKEVNFAVESTPPPVSSLLLPQTGMELTSPIRFEWQTVTDASPPTTYTIQIATNPDFATSSIVIEKIGLTQTAYSSEKPYYWRARAIDGATNEGNWANPGTFFIVGGGIPVWTIVVIAIVAAILIFALGYYVNMKIGKSKG